MFVVIFHVFSICYTTSCTVFLFMIWTVDILDVEIKQITTVLLLVVSMLCISYYCLLISGGCLSKYLLFSVWIAEYG